MKNYIQPGNTLTVTAPTGGVKGGDLIIVGSIFGVVAYDAEEGEKTEIATTGVFDLPKLAEALTAGAKAYWKAADGKITATASGNTLIGHVIEDAAEAAATARVRLSL